MDYKVGDKVRLLKSSDLRLNPQVESMIRDNVNNIFTVVEVDENDELCPIRIDLKEPHGNIWLIKDEFKLETLESEKIDTEVPSENGLQKKVLKVLDVILKCFGVFGVFMALIIVIIKCSEDRHNNDYYDLPDSTAVDTVADTAIVDTAYTDNYFEENLDDVYDVDAVCPDNIFYEDNLFTGT